MAKTVKMKLKIQPQKGDKAWLLTFEDNQKAWFPFSTITSFDPNSLLINIHTWILKQKKIKFKV